MDHLVGSSTRRAAPRPRKYFGGESEAFGKRIRRRVRGFTGQNEMGMETRNLKP